MRARQGDFFSDLGGALREFGKHNRIWRGRQFSGGFGVFCVCVCVFCRPLFLAVCRKGSGGFQLSVSVLFVRAEVFAPSP